MSAPVVVPDTHGFESQLYNLPSILSQYYLHNKCLSQLGLLQRNSPGSGAWKVQDQGADESPFPGLQMDAFLLYPSMAREREGKGLFSVSLLIRPLTPYMRASPS